MKPFGKRLEELFKSEKKINNEQLVKSTYSAEEIDDLDEKLEEKYSGDFKDLLDSERVEDYAYWESEFDPKDAERQLAADTYEPVQHTPEGESYYKSTTEFNPKDSQHRSVTDYEYAEGVAGENETTRLDNEGLDFILGKNKKEKTWSEESPSYDEKEEDLLVAPEIEEENLHKDPKDVTKKDIKRFYKKNFNYDEYKKNLAEGKVTSPLKTGKQEIEQSVQEETVPEGIQEVVEEKVEQPVQVEEESRVKPEVIVELEQKEQVSDEYTRFKLAKEAAIYLRLVKNNPDLEKLRPRRGPGFLSVEEINAEIEEYGDKKEISTSEFQFLEQCKKWTQLAKNIKGYEGKDLKNPDGSMMSSKQIQGLQREYYSLGETDSKKFSLLNFEFFAEPKVEKGEWKKAEFTWHEEDHKGVKQWVHQAGTTKYITNNNPTIVADLGQPAKFFYTVRREFPPTNKGKLIIVDLRLPIPLDPNYNAKNKVRT